MKYIFKEKDLNKVIVVLHGTGGNEEQFLGVGTSIDNEASVLSIRGNINENGMNRFFIRFGMGLYDLENYEEETINLYNTITEASEKYGFSLDNVTIAGFSNGANIAIGLLQDYPNFVNNYILFSPDFIYKSKDFKDLTNTNVFISTATNDPYCDYKNVELLISKLENSNAKVEVYLGNGHELNHPILNQAVSWYKNI